MGTQEAYRFPKVIEANRSVSPGSLCQRAKESGAAIVVCGDSNQGWEGFCWFHPILGECDFPFESSEDCALDFLRTLGVSLAETLNARLVSRS